MIKMKNKWDCNSSPSCLHCLCLKTEWVIYIVSILSAFFPRSWTVFLAIKLSNAPKNDARVNDAQKVLYAHMNAQKLSMQAARKVFKHSREFPHTREAGDRAYFYL